MLDSVCLSAAAVAVGLLVTFDLKFVLKADKAQVFVADSIADVVGVLQNNRFRIILMKRCSAGFKVRRGRDFALSRAHLPTLFQTEQLRHHHHQLFCNDDVIHHHCFGKHSCRCFHR